MLNILALVTRLVPFQLCFFDTTEFQAYNEGATGGNNNCVCLSSITWIQWTDDTAFKVWITSVNLVFRAQWGSGIYILKCYVTAFLNVILLTTYVQIVTLILAVIRIPQSKAVLGYRIRLSLTRFSSVVQMNRCWKDFHVIPNVYSKSNHFQSHKSYTSIGYGLKSTRNHMYFRRKR